VRPPQWRRADPDQRALLMLECHRIIGATWSLEGVRLATADLPAHQRGTFSPGESPIVALARHLMEQDNVGSALVTLVHENRHAFQHRVMDAAESHPAGSPEAIEVELWEAAVASYAEDQGASFARYAYNAIEVDAREAGSMVVSRYWQYAYHRHRGFRH
jgi:hypothetical protein